MTERGIEAEKPVDGGIESQVTRVVVVEDDPYALKALLLMLTSDAVRVTHSCSTINDGLAAVLEDTPDILLTDLDLKGDARGGIKLLQRIRAAKVRVPAMILTHTDPTGVVIRDSVTAGARGFYRKDTMAGEKLVPMLVKLSRGGVAIEPELMGIVVSGLNGNAGIEDGDLRLPITPLSRRECEVLMLINQQYTVKEIVRELHIGEPTVRTFLRSARKKFGNRMNTHQVALYAALLGLL